MGSIESYDTAQGLRWRVRYRKPDHSQGAKRGFTTKKEAGLWLAGVEVSKATGSFVDPRRSGITVSEWMDLWLAGRGDLAPTSYERTRGIVELHIKPAFGRRALSSLDHESIQAWVSTLPVEPRSARKMVNVLSGALEKAVQSKRLSANPARHLDLPRAGTAAKRYLTHEQVRSLAEAVDGIGGGRDLGYGLLIRVLAYCGLRWGELAGLRVKDIDFDGRRLVVQHTVVEVKGVQHISRPKSGASRRVPVPATILDELRSHVAGKDPEAAVFTGKRGGAWLRNRTFRRGWFDDAAIVAGVPGLTPHELRHTAASLAISAGANVKAVQRILGHASAAMTLDVYADLFDDDLDAVSDALDHKLQEANVSKVRPTSEITKAS